LLPVKRVTLVARRSHTLRLAARGERPGSGGRESEGAFTQP
jgi:hypothetical protein